MTSNLPAHRVADEVRAGMARKRVTQQALAAAISLSQAALSRRLRGEVAFDVNELTAVAAHLDIPLSDLLPSEAVA